MRRISMVWAGILIGVLAAWTGCQRAGSQASWHLEQLASPVTASLRGLSVVSESTVWASGSNGAMLRTIDGGQHWTILTVPEADELDFRDVQAFDADRALLMTAGTPARIYRTEDGGQNWSIVYKSDAPEAFLDGMAFWDDRRGVAMSDPVAGHFLVIRTEDGGRTWTEVTAEAMDAPLEGEAGFAASGTSIAVGPDGLAAFGTSRARVLRSVDWGKTWHAVDVPIRTGAPSQGVFSICFWGDGQGVLTGGDYAADTLSTLTAAYTRDSGMTWRPAHTMPAGFRSGVTAHGQLNSCLLAVGTAGCSVSTDSGLTWTTVSDTGFHAVQAAPGTPFAFSSGASGRLARWVWQ